MSELVDRILVSEPGKGPRKSASRWGRARFPVQNCAWPGRRTASCSSGLPVPTPASFQTAVGAQDALRSALERSGENVRVEMRPEPHGRRQ